MRKKTLLNSFFHFAALVFAYPNLSKLKILTTCFLLLAGSTSHAQIHSTTPDETLITAIGNSYFAFELPTETDALLLSNGIPVQVMISTATAPNPEFHYNYNNGQYVGSRPINKNAIPGALHLYADDVALTYNGSNLVAFITCRADMGGGNTQIYIYRAVWITFSNSFNISGAPQLVDSRTETNPVDYFDRVKIAYKNNGSSTGMPYNTELAVTYSKNGNIIIQSWQLSNGNITLDAVRSDLFSGGNFSGPDISIGDEGHYAVSAVYRSGNTSKIQVQVSDHVIGDLSHSWYWWWAYSITDANKKIRIACIDEAHKYDWVLSFDELDNQQRKSDVVVVARSFQLGAPQGVGNPAQSYVNDFSSPYFVNAESESFCSNNFNYVYTGFPSVKYNSDGANFETVWQQVACVCYSLDFCNINALSKRFILDYDNNSAISLVSSVSPEMYVSNSDRFVKNTVFPAIASIRDGCSNFYSFGKMDDGTSENGEVCYKKSSCNSIALRPFTTAISNNINLATHETLGNIQVYPNPASSLIRVTMKGFTGKITASLYSTTGAMLNTFNVSGKPFFIIDGAKLSSGVYLLKIADERGLLQLKKIMIVR